MDVQREVTLWPTPENYARFRELCDDEVPGTYAEFERRASQQLSDLAAQGIIIDKISFDPELMAEWCIAHFGKVDSETRSYYAGFIALAD